MASVLILLEYDAAIVAAREVIYLYPDYPAAISSACCGTRPTRSNRGSEATLEKAIAIAPALFDVYVRNRAPWHRPEEDHIHTLEGLRKAGLAEQ